MSNYAPNPTKQDIYNQLATISLNDVTAEQIQKLTNPVTISSDNQDKLITMNTVNQAAMRDGGPMPETSEIVLAQATDSGVPVVVKTPKIGEVWQIINGQANVTDIVGDVQHEFYYTDRNNNRTLMWYYTESGSSNIILQTDSDWNPPFFFDSNQSFTYEANGNFTDSTLSIYMIRVR